MRLLRFSVLLLVLQLVLLSAIRVPAQLVLIKDEFQVNSFTSNSELYASVAVLPNGDFITGWTGQGHDGSSNGIFAQRFLSTGAFVGTEFQVNSTTANTQEYSSISAGSNGNFVIVWHSGTGPGRNIFGQRYTSDGLPAGGEFLVNSYTTSDQIAPMVASAADGSFVAVWQSEGQDSPSPFRGIFGKRFASDGATIGGEFQINTVTNIGHRFPVIASTNRGEFVVAWSSYSQDGNSYGIFAQRFSSAGTFDGTEFQVNTYTSGSQDISGISPGRSVGINNAGDFVISWTRNDGDSFGIFAQRFDSSGARAGTEFQVNTYTTGYQTMPDVAADQNNGFLILWHDGNGHDGEFTGIFAQQYDSNGVTIGKDFQVNTYTTSYRSFPAAAYDENNHLVVIYSTGGAFDGNSNGIAGQIFAGPTLSPTATSTSTATATATSTSAASSTATATVTATPPPGASATCPAMPAMGCAVPTRGKLIIKDSTDNSKDKMVWKFGKGPQLMQSSFGDPVATNGYAFCVYDDSTLKIDLTIPAGMPWEALSTKGYQYKDSAGANDGVTKVKLIGADAGKSKLQLKGKGAGLGVPMAASMTNLFAGSTAVTVQLHGNGSCWETAFTPAQSKHRVNSYAGKF